MKEEFKLNYYFEKYKDINFNGRNEFRARFIKKHGAYRLLNELILMIERYQVNKYGERLTTGYMGYKTKLERKRSCDNERSRRKARLGR